MYMYDHLIPKKKLINPDNYLFELLQSKAQAHVCQATATKYAQLKFWCTMNPIGIIFQHTTLHLIHF